MKKDALKILKDRGFTPVSDLNFCLACGIEYYIGNKENKAAIAAFITDEYSNWWIDKEGLKVMAETARTYGIGEVILFTDYGIELHSKHEKPQDVGFNKIEKIISE